MESLFSCYENRLFVCYGLTRDCFCPPTCELINFDEYLHQHLRHLGYRRLMFYSHLGMYFLDAASHDTVMGRRLQPPCSPTTMPQMLRKLAPGGLSLRKRKSTDALGNPPGNQKWRYPDFPATELVPKIRQIMKGGDIPSAIIFNTDHLESFFQSRETATFFRGMLEQNFRTLPAKNKNIMIFVFGMDSEVLFQHIQGKPWDLLFHQSPDGITRGIATHVRVPPPEKDEVSRIIQHYRLIHGVKLDYGEYDWMVTALTAFIRTKDSGSGKTNVGLRLLETRLEEMADKRLPLTSNHVRKVTQIDFHKKSALERLNEMVAVTEVKELVHQTIQLFEDAQKFNCFSTGEETPPGWAVDRLVFKKKPIWESGTLHLALVGNPGTGKTTVAHLIGEIYRDAGILELGHTIVCTRKDLVGQYIGETAIKTASRIDAAMGGVLFIDEAYSLVQGGENDFGAEAVTQILEAMTSRMGQFMVILAGYPNEIQALIDSNPGFTRRIQKVCLEDHPPELLEKIFRDCCRNAVPPLDLDPELDAALPDFFKELCNRKTETFGNAGTVKDEIFQHVLRASEREPEGKRRIAHKTSFPQTYQPYFEKRVAAQLNEIETLIGLESVKTRIQDLIVLKNHERRRAIQQGIPEKAPVPGHYLFVGNPGTGKTTVARMMAEQFRQIGLLKRGHLVSKTASELSGRYLGSTENNTREILEKSLGGVCFLDEAHQLATPHGYGSQALGVIVPFLTDHEAEFSMIFAGYPDSIDRLMDMDPGLRRRFDSPIRFDDYSADELFQIFRLMAGQEHMQTTTGADRLLQYLMADIIGHKTKSFGNAGTVKKLLEKVRIKQANRLNQASDDMELSTITEADIPTLEDILDMI